MGLFYSASFSEESPRCCCQEEVQLWRGIRGDHLSPSGRDGRPGPCSAQSVLPWQGNWNPAWFCWMGDRRLAFCLTMSRPSSGGVGSSLPASLRGGCAGVGPLKVNFLLGPSQTITFLSGCMGCNKETPGTHCPKSVGRLLSSF